MASAGPPAVTDAFGAIAHPVRRLIVAELASGEKAVGGLAVTLPVTRSAVSQHLRIMLDVGLVTQERIGREHRYRLRPECLDEIKEWLAMLDASCGRALQHFGHFGGTPGTR